MRLYNKDGNKRGLPMTDISQFEALYIKAREAGLEAGNGSKPTPMIVGSPSTVFGDDIDPTKPTYFVEDGVCGFAWVNVKPGNSAFAKYLVKSGRAHSDSYYGGITIWVSDYNQSMQRKEAYAHAFAKVLSDAGIRAYASSRMD